MNLDTIAMQAILTLFNFALIYATFYVAKQVIILSKIKKKNPIAIGEKVIFYTLSLAGTIAIAFIISSISHGGINYMFELFLVLLPACVWGTYNGISKYSKMSPEEKIKLSSQVQRNRGSYSDM